MAIEHNVAGPVIVTWNSVQLGYTRDGVSISIEPQWADIMSDDYGGDDGVPSDSQFMGAIASVSAELVKYEASEVRKLTSFEKAGTAGTLPAFGTLARQDTEYATLLLDGGNEDWTFAQAFLRDGQEVNKGTKYSTFQVGWECWINNTSARVLFTIS